MSRPTTRAGRLAHAAEKAKLRAEKAKAEAKVLEQNAADAAKAAKVARQQADRAHRSATLKALGLLLAADVKARVADDDYANYKRYWLKKAAAAATALSGRTNELIAAYFENPETVDTRDKSLKPAAPEQQEAAGQGGGV